MTVSLARRIRAAVSALAVLSLLAGCGSGSRHPKPAPSASHPAASNSGSGTSVPSGPSAPSGALGPTPGAGAAPSNSTSAAALPSDPLDVLDLQMTGPASGFALAAIDPSRGLPSWSIDEVMFPRPASPDVALLHTADGGAHWTDVMPKDPFAAIPTAFGTSLFFLSGDTGWMAIATRGKGTAANIFVARTTDAGVRWQVATFSAPFGNELFMDFTSPSDGWILALSGPGLGLMGKAVYVTTDGGSTWREASCSCELRSTSLPGDSYPTGLSLNGSHAFVTALYHGDSHPWFYGTSDGGSTWQRIAIPIPAADAKTYQNVYPPVFSGQQGAMFVQFVGQTDTAIVYRTSDGGRTWAPASASGVPASTGQPLVFDWVSPAVGYAVSATGTLYRTQDGGAAWTTAPLPARTFSPMAYPPVLSFGDASHGLLSGRTQAGANYLLATSDGGTTWTARTPDVAGP